MAPHRLLPALAAACALLLAGCASEDPPSDTPAAGDGPELHADTSTSTGPVAEQVVATRTVEEQPVHMEGTTATGGCAYVFTPVIGQGTCEYTGGESSFLPLEGGAPLRLAGTLTWTATAPNTNELNVYVLHQRDGTYWWDHESPLATGPSPLSFDFDLSAYNETEVAVSVSSTQAVGVPVAYAAASTPQDFVLDAVFSSVVLRA